MQLFKKISLKFEEKDYEIRILYNDTTINVVAFLNNFPANGFRHQIKLPKNCDVPGVLQQEAVVELVEISKTDIIEKRWGKFSQIIHENMPNA